MRIEEVDIIVPVFVPNQEVFNVLKECLDSIIENTQGVYTFIIINDCSPFLGVFEYLQNFKTKHYSTNIVILNNEINEGFVKTVNIGMSYSGNDVLLLNSDTIVTTNWLDKIKKAAYSNPKIATVSPFSNSATILSLPIFCEDNNLPEGYTPNELARLVENYFPAIYQTLPTAHGFCMYIKRTVLNEVGLFDAEKFGRGYGEENDFSIRCNLKGYSNVLDSKTFIYHKGEASFQGDKIKLGNVALNIIRNDYPSYEFNVMDFVRQNPLKKFQETFNYLTAEAKIKIYETRGNILVVTHDNIGGSEKFLKDLFDDEISTKYNIYILKNRSEKCTLYFPDRCTTIEFKYDQELYFSNEISNLSIDKIYNKIVTECNIDLVFINSFINTSFDIVGQCKTKKIPLIYIIHDYNLICPTNSFIDNSRMFCGICLTGNEKKNCLSPLPGSRKIISEEMLRGFRVYVRDNVLKDITLFISPSETAINYISEFYGCNDLPYRLIEHGIENSSHKVANNDTEKLNVAFIGAIGYHKGYDIINTIARKIKQPGLQFHLFGYAVKALSNIKDHGNYDSGSIGMLLSKHNIDLIILPSLAPETFMYTLSEAWSAGIPVIVNDIGAPGERVKKNGMGWVVDFSKPYLDEIVYILKNKKLLLEMKSKIIQNYKPVSLEEMRMAYLQLFKEHMHTNSSHKDDVLLAAAYVTQGKKQPGEIIPKNDHITQKSIVTFSRPSNILTVGSLRIDLNWTYRFKINYIYKGIRKVYRFIKL